MDEIEVSSWNDLNDRLYEEAWDPTIGRFRPSFAYRGVADASEDLTSTLARLGGPYADLERPMLRNFRKYAGRHAVPGDSEWNWLAVAQHHGLPTRLLDWTWSPFVALHFATQDVRYFDVDAVVWAVNYVEVHRLVPPPLREMLDRDRSDLFTTEMLATVAPTLQEFDGLSRTDEPFVAFFEPPSLDDRIVNQSAVLSVMSSATAALHDWLEDHPKLARRILIPAKLKWEIRDKLDQANVTERVLFPGLDGLSRWLARYYTPREK